jgi:L-ascorbate metabolism protein UlaG (beta-lactamase superfamily)
MGSFAARLGLILGLAVVPAAALAEGVTVQWYGQSAVRLVSPEGRVIVIDPFLKNNPVTPEAHKDLKAMGRVDLILITHAHGDHMADAPALARLTGARVGVNADLGRTYQMLGLFPEGSLIRFNKGGPIQPLGEGITVTMTRAEHSSEVLHTREDGSKVVHSGGEPAGYVIRFENGYTVYHAGDTGVFGDMAFIGRYYQPDLALVPIGGHFTMDPAHAAYAVNELLKPGTVIPIHYGTFPPLKGTPEQFRDALGDSGTRLVVMEPGGSRVFAR